MQIVEKFSYVKFSISLYESLIFIIYFIVLMLVEGDYLLYHLQEHDIFPNK